MTTEEAYRRAGGRRHYNQTRQIRAIFRRDALLELLAQSGMFRYGARAAAARALGVSQATISRDVAAILRAWNAR